MTDHLKFGWHMPSFPVDGSSGRQLVDRMLNTLDKVGEHFDSAWADDHFHPWASWIPSETDALECMTTIAYLAGAVPDIKFGSSVLCQSFRNPAMLAKMAANLQLFSGGRFLFGIGAGWLEEEYLAYDYPFPKASVRIAQLEEAVQIIRKLWTESPASFAGQHYRVDNAYCEPRPSPLPPILIGGGGEKRTLRVVAKHADWWNIPGGTAANYAHKLSVLRGHCEVVGRNYDEILKTWSAEVIAVAATEAEARKIAEASPYKNPGAVIGTPDQVAEQLQVYLDIGVQYLIVRCVDFPRTEGIELFCAEVMPKLQLA